MSLKCDVIILSSHSQVFLHFQLGNNNLNTSSNSIMAGCSTANSEVLGLNPAAAWLQVKKAEKKAMTCIKSCDFLMQGFGQRFCLKTMHIVFVDLQRQHSGITLASKSKGLSPATGGGKGKELFSFSYNNADRGCNTVYIPVL